ncbi:hypothetical protein K1719_024064 [Acacia pycnantha]|nr:hypothetical protein K1719_024064 [Acacia pycnantha]
MAEVGVSVAAKLAEYLVDPTLQQLEYLFCVGKVTRNVEIKKEELILKQGKVQEHVQEAINRTERIDDEVNRWKSDVKSLIAEVENLEEVLKVNNGCLRGWLPTWRRYCLCKKLAKTTKRMIDLNTKSDCFKPFSHHVIIPGIGYHTSQNFKLFNSTQRAFDQLWEALKDDGSFMIGLWGMGGSGKTTLVQEVGKKAKDSQLFDRVVLTTISQSPDIRKIQGEIAVTLGIKLEEEYQTGRAERIALRLENKEQILIILDDVWAKLHLEEIGIRFGGNHQRSCKVVLTTRRLDVCTLMECQKMIQLELLKEDEAWTLFQTHANVGDAAKEDMARAIAKECQGLPIAIEAVGTCLKGKGTDEMKYMLYRLRNAQPIYVDKGVPDPFACLELSYDYLETPEAKKLLLMCAMFPEDHNIDVEYLFRYGMGLGLNRGVYSFEIARSIVRTAINHLIASSLLMCSPKFNHVTMHDVVRDFALWKASKEHRTIMAICTEESDKLIGVEEVNDCYAFSSWYDDNSLLQFLSQFHAPKLEFLLLRLSELLDISHATFEGTKGLKALIIMCNKYWDKIELQPQSIQHLSNLQTLRLQNWNLRDISFVVSLTRLEILDLQGCEFARVPDGIEKLSKLKLLDLSRCRIDECCYKVIGRCSKLEELYVSKHFSHPRNTNCYEYLGGSTANLSKFRRYNLEIGELDSRGFLFQNEGTRSLSLGQLNISLLGAVFKDLAQRATIILFYELKGCSKSFMANIVQVLGGMNELTTLCLQRCLEIEYIIDETIPHEDVVVPRLDELVLEDMHILKQLWRGPSPLSLFQKLKRLNIFNCPQLLNIFPAANCNLGNLKSLTISNCPMLTSLFPVSAACTLLSLMELRIKDAPQMKFVFGENANEEQLIQDQDESQIELRLLEYLKLKDLPNLVGICSRRYCPRWPSIKEIKWRNCPNMKLQQLECHQLGNEEYKSLALIERTELANCGVESIFHYQIGFQEQIPTFQCLKELTLKECARLKFVFSAHICQNLPELTSVTISRCEELEAIFLGNEETPINLCITESRMLKLKSLEISECNKLKFVLSSMISAATSMLPQLSTLTVLDCSQMEEIFKCSNIEDHDTDSEREIKFPNMRHMELNNLPMLVNICQGLKLNIGGFKLRTRDFCEVKVHGCPKLMPIRSAIARCTKERLIREYELKYSQLNNKEALNCPLSILNVGEPDIQSPRVEHHKWRIIGDDDQEEADVSEILRSKQQMLGGVVPTQLLSFQYLHSLEVTGITKLKFLFSISTIVQNSLPKLTSLTLSNCEELEVIFGHSGDDDANYGDKIVLSSLKEIELRNLPNFKSVCQVGLQIQVELTDIDICNCPKFVDSSLGSALQQLGTLSQLECHQLGNEEYKSLALIRRIELANCGVESIFHYQIGLKEKIPAFQCLKELTLKGCARLKFVFSAHICQNLPELTSVTISRCEELEAIFLGNEETPINLCITESCMLKLKSLQIFNCNKLKFVLSFMIGAATSMLPQLCTLIVSYCSQMEEIFKCSNIEDHDTDSEREMKFPNMRHMELNNLPMLVNICQGFKLNIGGFKLCKGGFKLPTGESCKVKVHGCPKLMLIRSAIARCTEERLIREYELKYNQLNNKEAFNLPLSILNVGELDIQSPGVEDHCWQIIGDDDQEETDDSKILRSEQQMVGGVVPTQFLSFQYILSLKVTGSKKLKFLFSMSTIVQNSLPKLTSLTLSNCEELEVIFGHSGDDDANYGDTIVLSSLKEIELRNLPNFKSVCQVGLQIQVELTNINICNCPKYVDSSVGLTLQQLGTFSVSIEYLNVETSSNVNEEKGTMLISRAEQLWLEDSMNLIFVWEGPTFIKFQNLVRLDVTKCRRLKCIFPSTVMRSLPCLEDLWIEECEELEEIMSSGEEEHNHLTNESSNNSFCFPQLEWVTVMRCRKLKWLFPSLPSTQRLPMLRRLEIEECSQLKGVCNSEVEIHEEGFYNNSLPKLKYLTVEGCPMFSETTLAALERVASDNALKEEEMNAMMQLLL